MLQIKIKLFLAIGIINLSVRYFIIKMIFKGGKTGTKLMAYRRIIIIFLLFNDVFKIIHRENKA